MDFIKALSSVVDHFVVLLYNTEDYSKIEVFHYEYGHYCCVWSEKYEDALEAISAIIAAYKNSNKRIKKIEPPPVWLQDKLKSFNQKSKTHEIMLFIKTGNGYFVFCLPYGPIAEKTMYKLLSRHL
jgi:hypothetical protein